MENVTFIIGAVGAITLFVQVFIDKDSKIKTLLKFLSIILITIALIWFGALKFRECNSNTMNDISTQDTVIPPPPVEYKNQHKDLGNDLHLFYYDNFRDSIYLKLPSPLEHAMYNVFFQDPNKRGPGSGGFLFQGDKNGFLERFGTCIDSTNNSNLSLIVTIDTVNTKTGRTIPLQERNLKYGKDKNVSKSVKRHYSYTPEYGAFQITGWIEL